MAAGKAYGVSKIFLNGVDYRTMPGTKIKFGGVKKTSQYGSGKRVGSSHEPVPAEVSGKIVVMADTDIEAIRNFAGGQVDVETDVGLMYSIANAEVMEPPEMADQGGGLSFEIEGDAAEKA